MRAFFRLARSSASRTGFNSHCVGFLRATVYARVQRSRHLRRHRRHLRRPFLCRRKVLDEVVRSRTRSGTGFLFRARRFPFRALSARSTSAKRFASLRYCLSHCVLVSLGGLAFLAAACTPQPAPIKLAPAQAAAFASFLSPAPLEPYQAKGAAQVSYRGNNESGELSVQGEPGPQFRILLRARVTGSLALDVRFDRTDLLIVDYVNSSYFLGGNTPAVRREVFSLDMTPLDFQMALTGRVPESLFREGGGVLGKSQSSDANPAGQPEPPTATFSAGGAEYRFVLDASGLPTEWSKWTGGVATLRVEYRSYSEQSQTAGPPIRLPERIRIYAGEPQPRLVLGLREWRIGADPSTALITFIPSQDILDRFKAQ